MLARLSAMVLLFVVQITTASGQTYSNYVDPDHLWYKQQHFQTMAPQPRVVYFSMDSTLIDGHYYHEKLLSEQEDGGNPTSQGYFRQEGSRVYHRGHSSDILYFDMSLQVGEELKINSTNYVVFERDFVTYEDQIPRLRLMLACDADVDRENTYTLIEGIGFLEEHFDNCERLVDEALRLICYSTAGGQVYQDPAYDQCWTILSTQSPSTVQATLSPNPAHDYLEIPAAEPIDQALVYGSDGRLWPSQISGTQLHTAHLARGTYVLRFRIGEVWQHSRFVKY